MPRRTRKKIVSWVIQTVAGSPGTVAEKCFRVAGVPDKVEFTDVIKNGNFVGAYQSDVSRVGGRYVMLPFTSELRGTDIVDCAFPEGVLLQACGFDKTGNGTTPNIYYTYKYVTPLLATESGDTTPIDFKHGIDGLGHNLKSCVGNVEFVFEAGQEALMNFDFRGLVDSTKADSDTSGFYEITPEAFYKGSLPIPVSNASLTLTSHETSPGDTYTPVILSLKYNIGNEIDERKDMNGAFAYSQPIITGYEPEIELQIEVPKTMSDFNLEDLCVSRTLIDIEFIHGDGAGAGQEWAISFSGYITDYSYDDVNGKLVANLTMEQDIDAASQLTLVNS